MTAIAGQIWTAAQFNTHVRDNLNETMPAKSPGPQVWDAFERVTSNGWSTSGSGHSYAVTGTGTSAQYSVDGLTGNVAVTGTIGNAANRFATVDCGTPDQEVVVAVTTSVMPTGNSQVPGAVVRFVDTSNSYYAVYDVQPSGVMGFGVIKLIAGVETNIGVIVPSFTYTPGTLYGIRLRVKGNQLAAKAWVWNSGEPVDWGIIASDTAIAASNRVGVMCRLATGNTNTLPVTYKFDNLVAGDLRRNVFKTIAANSIDDFHPSTLYADPLNTLPVTGTAFNPTCVLTKTANQANLTNNADVVVTPWTALRNDQVAGAAMFATGSPDRITIRATGTYDIGVLARHENNTTGVRQLFIYRNGSTVGTATEIMADAISAALVVAGATVGIPMSVSRRMQLTSGDTLFAIARQNSGVGTVGLFGSSNYPMMFWAAFVRAHGG
jgi:hypothetical protein